ncbi:transporter [Actinomyces sp. oral taxon 414]|uniref:RDD family protein n=1 Tax=Actinomyces sp. oral taxon 414 TaxID=712122 RepID=UPI0006AEFB06|nr:RDD family protein [Actinomyces sp. oral taxon 414]ALC99713.1 transporter [Actinomyces sp. oral taxon 414]
MTDMTDTSSERMMTPELMITGEAVALEVTPASVGLRLLSGLIDYGLYAGSAVLSLATWSTVQQRLSPGMSNAVAVAQISVLILTCTVVIPLTIEVLSRGRSAGRLVTGCRVVRDDGGAIRLRHCLVRTLTAVIEVWLIQGIPAVCSCVVTRRGKRLGDLLAGTYVINERSGAMSVPPLIMPPELAHWAAQTDIRPLPGNLALAGRTFLQRTATLQPDARARLGADLAARILPFVAPTPPAGTHPERFLAAVLCERRDRELTMNLHDRALEERDVLRLGRLPYGVA